MRNLQNTAGRLFIFALLLSAFGCNQQNPLYEGEEMTTVEVVWSNLGRSFWLENGDDEWVNVRSLRELEPDYRLEEYVLDVTCLDGQGAALLSFDHRAAAEGTPPDGFGRGDVSEEIVAQHRLPYAQAVDIEECEVQVRATRAGEARYWNAMIRSLTGTYDADGNVDVDDFTVVVRVGTLTVSIGGDEPSQADGFTGEGDHPIWVWIR